MMPTPDSVRRLIDRFGETVTVRRMAGTSGVGFDAIVKAVVRGYRVEAMAGLLVEGEREVRIAAEDEGFTSSQWPQPIRRGDKVIIGGVTTTVQTVDLGSIGDAPAMYVSKVTG